MKKRTTIKFQLSFFKRFFLVLAKLFFERRSKHWYSAQIISWKHQKLWKIVRKTYLAEFSLVRVVWIESKAYYSIALQTHFGSAQKGMDVRKIQNFKKKNLCKTVPFSRYSPEFQNFWVQQIQTKWETFPLGILK